jgi:hypothetical protein
VLKHLLLSDLGIVFAIFGTFALGVHLASSHAGRRGLWAMVVTVFGSALFLTIGGGNYLRRARGGQAVLAGVEEFESLPTIFANTLMMATFGVAVLLMLAGNVLLGVAVWRSGTLPKWPEPCGLPAPPSRCWGRCTSCCRSGRTARHRRCPWVPCCWR